jgi:hypothetical protein
MTELDPRTLSDDWRLGDGEAVSTGKAYVCGAVRV